MKTEFTIQSDLFPPYENESDEVNPGIHGKRLVEYFEKQFKIHGIETEEFYPEDWGWELPIVNQEFDIYLCCQNLDDNSYLCFLEPSKPQIRKWLFKKIDTRNNLNRISDIIQKIINDDSQIKEIKDRTNKCT